jgi:hypothetical protein
MSGKAPSSDESVEKVMTLSWAEFAKSMAALAPESLCANPVKVSLGSGWVSIRYEALSAVCLGGLLKLPRARLIIEFHKVSAAEREEFLRRFHIAFQRGGG